MAKAAFFTSVYNDEQHVRRCIESVLNQSVSDLAYYLVDNGSTDGTRAIIQEYATRDTRIIPIYYDINQRYRLVPLALQVFSYEHDYFAILDSDDWYELDFLQKALALAEQNNADIVYAGSRSLNEQTDEIQYDRIFSNHDFAASGRDIPYDLLSGSGVLWGRLYRISFLREIGWLSGDPFANHESDTSYHLRALREAKSIAVCGGWLHTRLLRTSSLIHNYIENWVACLLRMYECRKALYQKLGQWDIYETRAQLNVITGTILVLSLLQASGKSEAEKCRLFAMELGHPELLSIWKHLQPIQQNTRDEQSGRLKRHSVLYRIYHAKYINKLYQLAKNSIPGLDQIRKTLGAQVAATAGVNQALCGFSAQLCLFLSSLNSQEGLQQAHQTVQKYYPQLGDFPKGSAVSYQIAADGQLILQSPSNVSARREI